MKLNPNKTSILCISAARTYNPRTYIRLGGGNLSEGEGDVILSGKSMKLLGFHFSTAPTMEAHVMAIKKNQVQNVVLTQPEEAGLV